MAENFTVGICLMDDSLNVKEPHQYGLAVFCSDTTLTFCILDYKRGKMLGLQQLSRAESKPSEGGTGHRISYGDFLNSVLESMPWLKGPFKTVKIAWEGSKTTLIPSALFILEERERYLSFNFPVSGEEEVLSDPLVSMDSFNLYAVPRYFTYAAARYFPEVQIVSATSILIEGTFNNYKNRISTPKLFLNLRASLFDLMIFDGKQMIYFNTFPFLTPEDVTYYLIFVLEQLNLNPETIPLILFGNLMNGTTLMELLFKYIRHVEFGRRNDAVKYSYLLIQLPPYAHYALFNFLSCGL